VRPGLDAALPFWLDRPDGEALEIAAEVGRAGLDALWIGEMAAFDAFALATAVGQRARGVTRFRTISSAWRAATAVTSIPSTGPAQSRPPS
jgi:hypothetical protein